MLIKVTTFLPFRLFDNEVLVKVEDPGNILLYTGLPEKI